MFKVRVCSFCKGRGHTAMTCRRKAKKPLNRGRRMNKVGRVSRKLLDQRAVYLEAFPGPHYCFYCEYLGVKQELEEKDVQVEHFMTKNNHPELRFDFSNLVKSCAFHNENKSNMDGDKYLKKLDELTERNKQ